jgi:c-di-GMP-related signal transduction protein
MQYVARQPILDSARCLTAFELLFRDSTENRCTAGADADLMSKKTMDTAVLVGLDTLSGGHSVFLNCAHDLVVGGFPTLFPPDLTVIEVLETVEPSPEFVQACWNLKRMGYRIALDDFVPRPGCESLLELADLVKIDLQLTPLADCALLTADYLARKLQLLAEKVETEEEFRTALNLGFTLFQGYLFSKPNVLATANVDGLDPNQLRIFGALSKPRLNLREIEGIIKADPGLCYRLLRFLNSPAFYFQSEIRSVLHALVLLGEEEVRKWLLLVCAVLSGTKAHKRHLMITALVRARFLELIAKEARLPRSPLFILGMLSSMDAVLDIPLPVIAEQVAVSTEVRSALMGTPGRLRELIELALAYESADWESCDEIGRKWRIPAKTIARAYLEAVGWAKQVSEI